MNEPLTMVQMRLGTEGLLRAGRRLRVGWHPARGELDTGYLVHAILREALGEMAPQPFRLLPAATGGHLVLLGYVRGTGEALVARCAGAKTLEGVLQGRVLHKPMPTLFSVGRRYRFEVRCCPVERTRRDGPEDPRNPKRPLWRKGSEVDAFMVRWARVGERPTREQAYVGWLAERLGAGPGNSPAAAELVDGAVHLSSFRLTKLFRRTQRGRKGEEERTPRMLVRPEAVIQGELRVVDSEAFADRLARGVGRHRAFGFGMLLLRRAPGYRP